MPASASLDIGVPSVPLSFSNNFWGRDDAGVDPLLHRMQSAKTTCDELKAFYTTRAAIEEDYARKLTQLSRKPLGSLEQGTLRTSLDVARGETEAMGKQHALIAQQMKSELEEPLNAFAGGLKERKKIVQNGIERLLKMKQTQAGHVYKSRDKYEQDCLRIKGYLAQGHMVMGQEERKNKAKLEKTQINMAANSNEYEAAVKVLEETTGRWNKEWKAACDKFQDLEEERIDFTKSSLWAYANIASTVCVTDDGSCEKIRLALENCEVEKDIAGFIKICGTGQEIPDPPRYINFCRGDIDNASVVSEDENYTVAQFQRTGNPAFRSSSTTQNSHVPGPPEPEQRMSEEPEAPKSRHISVSAQSNSGMPAPLNYRQPEPNIPPKYSPSQHGDIPQVPHNEYPTEGMTMFCRSEVPPSINGSALSSNGRPGSRDSQSEYSNPSSFTSAEPMSGKTSPVKGPPVNGVELPGMASPGKPIQKKRSGFFSNSPFRRKSKVDHEHTAHTPSNRNTWNPDSAPASTRINLNTPSGQPASTQSSPTKTPSRQHNLFNRNAYQTAPEGEEPADPRAEFQLNVGNNVFSVASPDSHQSSQSTPRASMNNTRRGQFNIPPQAGNGKDLGLDPIAQALADLKSSSNNVTGLSKPATTRVPVDRYHGVQTPAPDQNPAARPAAMSAEAQARLAAQRGTPPPAYDSAPRAQTALGVPQPAHTKREMIDRSKNWGSSSMYGGSNAQTPNRPASRDGRRSPGPGTVPRAASPQPQYVQQQSHTRARSPGPSMMQQQQQQQQQQQHQQAQYRAASPNPYAGGNPRPQPRPQSSMGHPQDRPQMQQRQNSGMEMQLSSQDVTRFGDSGSGRNRQQMRPNSSYGGDSYQSQHHQQQQQQQQQQQGYDPRAGLRRERSKSMANVPMMPRGQPSGAERGPGGGNMSGGSGGMPQPLHFARAMYNYTAAIPEELTFSKGDILAVLRLQDDGWWEAEVRESTKGSRGGVVGLVPSNYLQRC